MPGSTTETRAHAASPAPPAARWLTRWARSVLAVYWLAWAVAAHLPRAVSLGAGGGIVQPDKLVHGLAMAGLTALLTAARPLGRGASVRANALIACLIALTYAALDEAAQHWVPMRTVSLADLAANVMGVLSAYLIIAAHAAPGRAGARAWSAYAARFVLILGAPSLVYFAFSPRASELILDLYQAIDLSRARADKTMHLVLGALLTWLLVLAAVTGRGRPRLNAALTIILMIGSAPVIEYLQRYTGRGLADPGDVAAHEYGVLLGLAVWAVVSMANAIVATARDAPEAPAVPVTTGTDRSESTEQTVEQSTDSDTRFVGHAMRVSGLTLISRLTGLARDATLAAAFGLGVVADAFFLGFLVPNLFRRLFGEGALASSFIPHYAELRQRDPETARRFASLCLIALSVTLAAITIVGEILLAAMYAGEWAESTSLAIRLTMVMLPYMPLVCAVALLGGVLQVHGRFGAPAAAPILLNVTMIAAALFAAFGPDADESMRAVAFWVAVSVLIAGVLQLVWQLVALRGALRLTWRFRGAGAALRSMLWMMGPMVAGLAVFQINALLDSLIAFFLSPRDGAAQLQMLGFTADYPVRTGSVAALQWAQRLYQFPLGVFGIAVATAIFPALSHAVARGRANGGTPTDGLGGLSGEGEFARILRQGLRLTMFIALPAAVGLMLVREPLTTVIYQRGAFTTDDAQRVSWILLGYAASVWAYSLMHVLTRAFYAQKDAATPLRVSLSMVGANLVLNLVLIWPLGAAGLAWSTAITGAAQAVILLTIAARRGGRPMDANVWRSWGRTAALTVVMAVLVWLVLMVMPGVEGGVWGAVAALCVAVVVGAGAIGAGAWVSGAPELRWLLRRRVE